MLSTAFADSSGSLEEQSSEEKSSANERNPDLKVEVDEVDRNVFVGTNSNYQTYDGDESDPIPYPDVGGGDGGGKTETSDDVEVDPETVGDGTETKKTPPRVGRLPTAGSSSPKLEGDKTSPLGPLGF